MTIHKHLTSALFAAAMLGMGVALPVYATGLPDPCPAESHTSKDKVEPLFISTFQSCRALGYQDGCTVHTLSGQTECVIDGSTVKLGLTDYGRKLEFWKSPDLSIQRVILRKRIGLAACSYNYNPLDTEDAGNMAPLKRRIAYATFCTDPNQITRRDLAPTPEFPEPDDTAEIFSNLEQTLGKPVAYAVFNRILPGEPPSILGAPGFTVETCDSAFESDDNCWFTPGTRGTPNPQFRRILEGNSQYIVRILRNDDKVCAVQCFDSDEPLPCREFCLEPSAPPPSPPIP